MPSLCVIFEAIGPYSAIGKIAMRDVETALEAGYKVSVVAKMLDESLRDRVEWLKLYVPPRGHALQWLTARHFVKRALGNRKFDIVHGHQPQIADLCDVFQCHYLTRVAHERRCLTSGTGWGAWHRAVQHRIVLRAEDYFYRRWNPHTTMLFNSALTREQFIRLYGRPEREQVLVPPVESAAIPNEAQRRAARKALTGETEPGIVVGHLGGVQRRKGYHHLIEAMKREPGNGLFLLMGGIHSEGFDVPELAGRFRAVGLVSDVDQFYAACDVLAVPSLYEPLGLVAFEAAARGVPVIATRDVGALPHLEQAGAGVAWEPKESLETVARQLLEQRDDFRQNAHRMAGALSHEHSSERLLVVYEAILREKATRRTMLAPATTPH